MRYIVYIDIDMLVFLDDIMDIIWILVCYFFGWKLEVDHF